MEKGGNLHEFAALYCSLCWNQWPHMALPSLGVFKLHKQLLVSSLVMCWLACSTCLCLAIQRLVAFEGNRLRSRDVQTLLLFPSCLPVRLPMGASISDASVHLLKWPQLGSLLLCCPPSLPQHVLIRVALA